MPVIIFRAIIYAVNVARFLDLELPAKLNFYRLHCSAMVVSFQMHTSVDKQKTHEIFVFTAKLLGFFAGFTLAHVDLAFTFGKGEGQYVGGFAYAAVGLI